MPDLNTQPPPGGDPQRAESYIKLLVQLLSDNKLIATHTDLTKFDPNALQDHYRVNISNYQIEVSHSKQPLTGRDMYVLLFINSPSVEDFYNAKGIIAYLILSDTQFKRFKDVAEEQIETRRKVEEEKRFAKAIKPIDELLDKIAKEEVQTEKPEKVSAPVLAPPPPQPPAPPVEVKPPPTLEDVQKALQQAAQQSTQLKPVPEPERPKNLDIPKVDTLPQSEPNLVPAPPQQVQPAPFESLIHMDSQPKNVLTENTPTGSNAPPPTGIDQAIDQAFQTSSNNSITPQTPPIGIN